MSNILERFEKFEHLWIKIPFLLYGLGFLIHNIYLTKFSFFDFEIIQTKYIYTGLSSIVFIILISLFIILRLDLDNASNNFKLKSFLTWAIRLPILTIILHLFIGTNRNFIAGFPLEILGENLSLTISSFLISFSFLFILGLTFVSFGPLRQLDYKIINPTRMGINIVSIPIFVLVLLSTFDNKELSSIFFFLFVLFIWTFSFLGGFSHGQKGLKSLSSPIKSVDSELGEKVKKIITNIFQLSIFLYAIFHYSINIYPLLPINLGGAKPVEIELELENESINGNLIMESSKWLIIQELDSSILRIKVDDILKIRSPYNNK